MNPIPKTGSRKNKSEIRVTFFLPKNMVANHHVSPHISPQIHHKNTTFSHLISPKPPAKHHNLPPGKKSQKLGLCESRHGFVHFKNLIRTNIIQPLNNAARPMNLNGFHNSIRPKPKVSALIT